MKTTYTTPFPILLTLVLCGCATIIKGTSQSIAITTPPASGAECTLSSREGNWVVDSPGVVTVEKSKEDIVAHCTKPGWQDGFATIPSDFEGWTIGNILGFPLVGLGVDAATGAINNYPHAFQIPMHPGNSSVADAGSPAPAEPAGTAPLHSVRMRLDGGVYVVPVTINDAIKLDFAVDSGSADVSMPADVVLTLMRTGTIGHGDFLGDRTFQLADGSTLPSVTFRIRSLRVGDATVSNVTASIAPAQAQLLLGQSFLGRFKSWSVDNKSHSLVLNGSEAPTDNTASIAHPVQTAALSAPTTSAPPSVVNPSVVTTATVSSERVPNVTASTAHVAQTAALSVPTTSAPPPAVYPTVATTAAVSPAPAPAPRAPPPAVPADSNPRLTLGDGLAALKRRDYQTALAAWKPLAEQGNPLAQNGLGYMYAHGTGVPEDPKLALQWFRKAIAQGSYEAGANLGSLYENGEGVAQDRVLAYMWYSLALAASSGDSQVTREAVGRVAKAMSEDDISRAKGLADTCQKSNFTQCGGYGGKSAVGDGLNRPSQSFGDCSWRHRNSRRAIVAHAFPVTALSNVHHLF